MEQSGNIPIFNISGTLFGNIPQNFMGKFSEYSKNIFMGMFHEYSANNIPETLFGNIPRNFIRNFFQISQEYVMEYSTNIYLPGGYFTPCFSFSIVDFEQVSVGLGRERIKNGLRLKRRRLFSKVGDLQFATFLKVKGSTYLLQRFRQKAVAYSEPRRTSTL